MNIWHMQLHPGESEMTRDEIFNYVKNYGVIGLGEQWKGDKGQPDTFMNYLQIGDIVIIRHQGPLCLVRIVSKCFKNTGEHKVDVWFPLYRKVELLDSDPYSIKNAYEEEKETNWSTGIYAPATLQNANNWEFAIYWYNNWVKKNIMKSYTTLLTTNHNLILTGAPGTGKTYLAKEIAESFGAIGERCGFVQFHPSFDYSDFIEGLRPIKAANSNEIGFERKDGIFMAFCRKALKAYQNSENKVDAPKYVFVIDEINRGEMSKIFGELFFSVDPGYRGAEGRISTQYSNLWTEEDIYDDTLEGDDRYKFYIPENVYIIGTMNDIDRSVESMDFAFRRRFAFIEIKAMENTAMLDTLDENIKNVALNRMKHLNYIIWHKEKENEPQDHQSIEGLSSAYHIGASYFLKLKNYNGDFNSLWSFHIEGVLREYLRGMEDLEENIERLKKAFDDDTDTDY